MMYQFDSRRPPLLADDEKILEIPPEALQEKIATTEWDERTESQRGGAVLIWDIADRHYKAVRYYRWARTSAVETIAHDREITITDKVGYSEQQKQAFEAFIGVEAGVGGQSTPFSAKISANLKITEENIRAWQSERTVEVKETIEGGHTYVSWSLFDVIETTKTTVYSSVWTKHRSPLGSSSSPIVEYNSLRTIVANYNDKHKAGRMPAHYASILKEEGTLTIVPLSIVDRLMNGEAPCEDCSCEDFIEYGGHTFCHRAGCGHDFLKHGQIDA